MFIIIINYWCLLLLINSIIYIWTRARFFFRHDFFYFRIVLFTKYCDRCRSKGLVARHLVNMEEHGSCTICLYRSKDSTNKWRSLRPIWKNALKKKSNDFKVFGSLVLTTPSTVDATLYITPKPSKIVHQKYLQIYFLKINMLFDVLNTLNFMENELICTFINI